MEKMDDGIKNSSSKKKEMTIFGIIAVLVIAVLLGGGYYLLSKPKSILNESLYYLTKRFKKIGEKQDLSKLIFESDQVKFEGKMNIDLNKDLQLGLENISLNITAHEDKKEQTAHYKIDADIDQKSLLELDTYLSDNKMYIMLKDILDKFYYTDQEYISFLNSSDDKDVDILMDIIEKSVKKVIHDNRFKKETVTKEIDEKEEKVTKLSLEITDQLLSELIQEIINQIKNNDQAMTALKNLSGEEVAEIKTTLDELYDSVKETNGETLLTYNVYYQGMNEIRMLELTDGEDSITYTANDGYHLEFKTNDEVIFDLKITTENQIHKINIVSGTVKIVGEIKEEDKLTTATFHLYESQEELGVMKLSQKQDNNTESEIEMIVESNETQLAKIMFHTKFTFGEKISLESIKDAKDINKMSVEEAQKILENIQNHEFLSSFMELFDMLNSNEESSLYDYDYDYDYDEDLLS